MNREEEIRGRLEAATPGPWEWGAESSDWGDGGPDLETVAKQPPYRDGSVSPEHRVVGAWGHDAWGIDVEQADADLIANAPADLAYLLAENARLRAQLDTVRELHRPADKTQWVVKCHGVSCECGDWLCDEVEITPCVECSELATAIDGGEYFIAYPCATARAALNQGGETNGE